MASAEFVNVPKPDVTLTLSYEEAIILKAVVGKITGSHFDGATSPRFHTDKIWETLSILLLNDEVEYHKVATLATGTIHFEDYPDGE